MLNIHFSWLEGIFLMVRLFKLAVVCNCHLNNKDLKEPSRIMLVSYEISVHISPPQKNSLTGCSSSNLLTKEDGDENDDRLGPFLSVQIAGLIDLMLKASHCRSNFLCKNLCLPHKARTLNYF